MAYNLFQCRKIYTRMPMIKWAFNGNVSVVYYKIYLSLLGFSMGLSYLVPHMSESGSQFSLLLWTQNISKCHYRMTVLTH